VQYKEVHTRGNAWPEITRGMREAGILDMEIHIAGTRLFMIMDTRSDFDHDSAMAELATKPGKSELETNVSRLQLSDSYSSAGEKWALLERIYKLDE
jgi:L-rhamnose mutarotase